MRKIVKYNLLSTLLLLMLPFVVLSQNNYQHFVEIQWKGIQTINISEQETIDILSFQEGIFPNVMDRAPLFYERMNIKDDERVEKVTILHPIYKPLTQEELIVVKDMNIDEQIHVNISHAGNRDGRLAEITFLPLVKRNGIIMKLTQASLKPIVKKNTIKKSSATHKQNSVLSSGDWYKLKLNEDGIYKLTYNQLKDWGVNVTNADIHKIGIFGNTGMMLPQMNDAEMTHDLMENPIYIEDGGDGQFNDGDYILFYGKAPSYWEVNKQGNGFHHVLNPYSESAYYFFTPNAGTGKRIEMAEEVNEQPTYTTDTFDDYRYVEEEKINLIKSGTNWFGESMSLLDNQLQLNFQFKHIAPNSQIKIESRVAARADFTSIIPLFVNGEKIYSHNVNSFSDHIFAQVDQKSASFQANGPNYNLRFEYNVADNNSTAWLDWIEMTAKSTIYYENKPLFFRDLNSVGENTITTFKINHANDKIKVWDITQPTQPKEISYHLSDNQIAFTTRTNVLKQFVAFELNRVKTPEFDTKVKNQDLHALSDIDFLIISPDIFKEQALRVGKFHLEHDDLTYAIVNPKDIYNEFSSGGQDISALRNFFRLLYHKPNQQRRLRYVMFMGNASYDYNNRVENNTLFVPSFEFENSYSEVSSHVSDDYFALLGEGEGYYSDSSKFKGVLDIGIGRVPAEDIDQARRIVDKFIHYGSNKSRTKGAWKNEVCIVADDEHNNAFVHNAENDFYAMFKTEFPVYNVNKIYLDAYKQIRTPGGQRYPQVNDAIKAKMEKGLFILTYIGHGGGLSLADERIMSIADIDGFTNYDKLSFFAISACEFSRFDDPDNITAGEKLLLNPNGGVFSMLTSSRLTYAGASVNFNKRAIKHLLTKNEQGRYPRLGDAIRVAKNMGVPSAYNYVLLGDPALQLAYPEYEIETTSINGMDINQQVDTLGALGEVTVKGFVKDSHGNLVSDYNGFIYPKVYDKIYMARTRGQDSGSSIEEFEVQDNILYQGKAKIEKGRFEFQFVLPQDIDYSYGKGKISYYAKNNYTEASGFTDSLYIGGTSNNISVDESGPEIKLFFNNRKFVDGDVVSTSPLFLSDLSDESGINTSGSSVGHDITAILDDNIEKAYILNDFYTTKLDTYKEGTVKFPFNDLEPGRHTIKLIAWDIYNNSSSASISFIVSNKIRPEITSLSGYPNPFTDAGADIVIKHNLFGEFIIASINIYDLSGRLIRTLGPYDMRSYGFEIEPIHWDGKDNYGNYVKKGMYVYSAEISDLKGYRHQKSGKLVKVY